MANKRLALPAGNNILDYVVGNFEDACEFFRGRRVDVYQREVLEEVLGNAGELLIGSVGATPHHVGEDIVPAIPGSGLVQHREAFDMFDRIQAMTVWFRKTRSTF